MGGLVIDFGIGSWPLFFFYCCRKRKSLLNLYAGENGFGGKMITCILDVISLSLIDNEYFHFCGL